MKKQILLALCAVFTAQISSAQLGNKLASKLMAANAAEAIEFYADEAGTQPIEVITDGTMSFYAKVPIRKGIAQKCGDYTKTEFSIDWSNNRKGVYKDFKDNEKTVSKMMKQQPYIMVEVDFTDEDKAYLWWFYVQDAEGGVIDLPVKMGGGRNRGVTIAEASLKLDLSGGKQKYLDYLMSKQGDFVFDYTDDFTDDALKDEVKTWFKASRGVEIFQFAWGERVPYTEGTENIRRQTAVVTWQDSDDMNCYKSGLTVFTGTPYPRTDYKFDGESANMNNSELIPCDRAK